MTHENRLAAFVMLLLAAPAIGCPTTAPSTSAPPSSTTRAETLLRLRPQRRTRRHVVHPRRQAPAHGGAPRDAQRDACGPHRSLERPLGRPLHADAHDGPRAVEERVAEGHRR